MSIGEQTKRELPVSMRLRFVRENVLAWLALFKRKPRPLAITPRVHLAIWLVIATVVLGCTMRFVDAWAVGLAQGLPTWLIGVLDRVTDFGRLTWILVPAGALLLLIASLATPALPRFSRSMLAAIAVRLSFLFTACALPGLVASIVKRLIGRGRPLVAGSADPFLYHPLGWNVEYAGLPSGHATNAFAAAVAIGALWPRTRPLMWTYAIVIALTRIALTAHFPSDVLAGAVIGAAGAIWVRRWFAARRLGFFPDQEGIIRRFAGPSFSRLKRLAGDLLA